LIVIDASLLIYAYNERMPQHSPSRLWLEETLSSNLEVGLPMQAILAFIRLSTNTKLHGPHSSVPAALSVIDSWLAQATVQILHPGPRHWEIFRRLCAGAVASGNLSTDAHFAALAIEHDAVLYSADTDFARFSGLHWKNPLFGK
jgi:toxin-antitoxin system PIN domain toxin